MAQGGVIDPADPDTNAVVHGSVADQADAALTVRRAAGGS
jgi:hypothetical protein